VRQCKLGIGKDWGSIKKKKSLVRWKGGRDAGGVGARTGEWGEGLGENFQCICQMLKHDVSGEKKNCKSWKRGGGDLEKKTTEEEAEENFIDFGNSTLSVSEERPLYKKYQPEKKASYQQGVPKYHLQSKRKNRYHSAYLLRGIQRVRMQWGRERNISGGGHQFVACGSFRKMSGERSVFKNIVEGGAEFGAEKEGKNVRILLRGHTVVETSIRRG